MAMRIAGRSRLIAVRRASCGLALLGIGLSAATAYAADTKRFDLPPGALGAALIAFGQQSGFDIGVTDSTIAGLRTRGLRGRYTPDEALARLLAGTGCDFSVVDSQTVRIVRLPDRPLPVRRRREPSAPAVVARVDPSDIVVVASKQAKIQMGSPKRNTLCITNTHINNHTDNPSRTVRVALSTCGGPEPLAH